MKRYIYKPIPESETFSYILGFIMADGYVCKSGLSISLQARDIGFLEDIAKFFQQYGYRPKWNMRVIKGKSYIRMRIHSRNLSHLLNEKGIHQRKSLTKMFPKDVPFIDAYLAGYFDGNGSVVLHRGYLELQFHSGSKTFMDETLKQIELLLGKSIGKTPKLHTSIWRFTLYGKDALVIGSVFYGGATFRLPRKQKKFLSYRKPKKSDHFWKENDLQFVRDTMDLPLQEVANHLRRSYRAVSKKRWLITSET